MVQASQKIHIESIGIEPCIFVSSRADRKPLAGLIARVGPAASEEVFTQRIFVLKLGAYKSSLLLSLKAVELKKRLQ